MDPLRIACAALLLSCWACGPKQPLGRSVPENLTQAPPSAVPPPSKAHAGPTEGRWGAFDDSGPVGRPAVLWETPAPGVISAPLASDGAQIYVTGGGTVHVVDMDGVTRWAAPVDAVGEVGIIEGQPWVGAADGRVFGFDRGTGQVLDTLEGPGTPFGRPFAWNGAVAWVTEEGRVCVAAGCDLVLPALPTGGVAVGGALAFVGTADGALHALSSDGVVWTSALPGPAVGHPLMVDGRVVVAFGPRGARAGGVMALDADGGERAWLWLAERPPVFPPVLAGKLLVPAEDGTLVALDPSTGQAVWETPGAVAPASRPAAGTHSLFVGSVEGTLVRMDLDDGGTAWTMHLGAAVSGQATLHGGMLVVGTADGRIIALQ